MFINKKIALVSDLHFGVHQNHQRWHEISLNFAKWFKDQLIENNIKDIVIAGDVNNDRNEISVQTLSVVSEIFKIWKDFNIKIIIGNHDAYYKDRCDINSLSQFSEWPNIEIYDENYSFEQFDKKFGFCPWSKNIEELPRCDVIFGHFSISGFTMVKGKICADGIKSIDVLKKSKLIITGHFHLRSERKYESGTIHYLGCPYELNWNDFNTKKGFHILDVDTMKTTFIENNMSPKHKKICLSELLTLGKITKEIKNDIKGNIVKFVIDKDIKTDKIEKLINTLCAFQPLMFKSEFINPQEYKLDETALENVGVDMLTTIYEFIEMLEIENKKDVTYYIEQLYKKVNNGN